MTKEKVIPQIRFSGFTDTWEQRELGEVVKEVTRNDSTSEAPIMMITANNGFIEQSERYAFNNAGESLKKYILLEKGELAYNHGASKLRPYGSCFALTTAENARIPFVYHCFSVENQNAEFMSIELNSSEIENQLRKIVSSGARMDGLLNISFDEYSSVSVVLPSIEEQDRIAGFLRNLDRLITLHQRKYDKLTKVKKAMLEKMFPENGSPYPEIRFKGFTDAWEQRKFSELTEIRSASRVHKEEWQSSGVPFYRSSDVMAALNGTENEKAFISEELYEKLSAVSGKLEKGDILVTGGGSVGKPYIVPNNEPLYTKDADLLWVKNNEKLVPYFIYTFFFSPAFSDYLNSVSHVGTIAHYTITQLEETPITLPCVSEQQKIGDYFRNIDSLITLHQRKLEKLKNIKKACLEKMFV